MSIQMIAIFFVHGMTSVGLLYVGRLFQFFIIDNKLPLLKPSTVRSNIGNQNILQTQLLGGFKHFLFSPQTSGKIPILTHMFQMGGSPTNQIII